jgi:hypothetical protein
MVPALAVAPALLIAAPLVPLLPLAELPADVAAVWLEQAAPNTPTATAAVKRLRTGCIAIKRFTTGMPVSGE